MAYCAVYLTLCVAVGDEMTISFELKETFGMLLNAVCLTVVAAEMCIAN
jgi:hypothetical protein